MKHARPDYDRFQDPAGKVPADEPVFLLRGQDALAHMAVRHYAFMAAQAGAAAVAEASNRHADAMMAWARKLPDLPGDPVEHVAPPSSGNADDFVHTIESSRAWMATAAGYARDVEFYRGLVVQIGEMLGKAAYTADDGSISEDVLCLKVPELVRTVLRPAPSVEIPVDATSDQLFRKTPAVVEAFRVTRENGEAVAKWCSGNWLSLYGRGDRGEDISHVAIRHGDGYLRADLGDWIVKELDGAFYPCRADIFPIAFQPIDLPVSAPAAVGLPILNGDHAEFEREWAGKDPKTRPDWPYPSFDARDWAEAFCALFKVARKDGRPDDGDDMGLMIGWFANALMRGLEHPRAEPESPIKDVTPEDMEHTARTLEMFVPRDPRAGPTYLALAEILRAEAAKKRAG